MEVSDIITHSQMMKEFGLGNTRYVAGMSGTELLARMFEERPGPGDLREIPLLPDTLLRSEEYWAGWALAHYQWYCARPFGRILEAVPLEDILGMYHPYHEMDIGRFTEEMERRFLEYHKVPRLRKLREINGFSQSELARRSGIKLRMIQLYEQKRNNINKAQVNTVAKLALALNCSIEDLLDDPIWAGELMLDRKF